MELLVQVKGKEREGNNFENNETMEVELGMLLYSRESSVNV